MGWRRALAALLLALPAALARAEEVPASGSDFGGAGLIEMRNARFREDGTLEFGSALRHQRRFWFVNFQALPFLETTFRLTERLNATTGAGMTTDRAFDLKLRLLEESDVTPALAVGLQDFIGTGLYAGEYVVASKRFWGLDVTAGLGWGRLATHSPWTSPLALASERFATRPRDVGRGGTVQRSWFRGEDMAPFAGVEWSVPPLPTPWGEVEGLRAKLEWSSDGLRDERGGYPARRVNGQGSGRGEAASPVNAGLQWSNDWMDAGLHWVHGTDLLLRLSFRLNPDDPPALPRPAPPPLAPRSLAAGPLAADTLAAGPQASGPQAAGPLAAGPLPRGGLPLPAPPPDPEAEALTAEAVFAALEEAGFRPLAYRREGLVAELALAGGNARSLAQIAGRVLRAAQPALPPEVEMLRLRWWQAGAEVAVLEIPRATLEATLTRRASPEEAWASARMLPATGALAPDAVRNPGPFWGWEAGPRLTLALGDPSRTLRWQAGAAASARVDLGGGWALAGSVLQGLLGNLTGGLPSDSQLPHVRSDYAEYARKGGTALTTLYAERLWNAAPDVFARATAGYLEPMFGGLSGEILWRPQDRGFALGLDLNWVAQRDFDQRLGFRGYSVATGHVSAYADLPVWNLYGVLRAGRYLAGDWGATFELGRRFASGIEVGGFATLTNVSAARFGEGSFDKGIYVRIPLDLAGLESRGRGTVLFRPVQRDGGQRLAVDNPLWELTRDGRAEELRHTAPAFSQ
ncbi:YjbH domain-containing protein [Roseomonas sp. GC11]|uniref:YjbH domain-containing protein n=1 Tax=Roseomonas sp. GC11 TaxID=2950546 RepID=UPI00210EAE4F|nr:YjbH domain-containing protein [Roseomonas sp. GC11]MCQ4160726.1 YjbH domain-containing protein [Roseomonas sp. GC11]